MRIAPVLALLLLALPARAWEFRAGEICELVHEAPGTAVRLTYDPRLPEYTITLRRAAPWPVAPVFAMRFDGPRGLTISTDRHVLSDGGTALTVTDRGFGNVLDGLQYNRTATALTGDAALSVPLDGAAPEVAAFRACAEGASV